LPDLCLVGMGGELNEREERPGAGQCESKPSLVLNWSPPPFPPGELLNL
jgi:hypothetical protein